ncbi:hypothetical protein [Nocardia sp. NPDC056100]|uniref:hypothetical protein n=1 Tax=Nocardia sp. NPDC056100 TaxID=3345712 RepID=UPI0035DAA7AD
MTDYTYTWNSAPPKFTWKKDGNGELELESHVNSWAQDSVKYGTAAGVDPRLVMAIIYNEGADTPQALRPGYDYGRWAENFVTDKPNGNSLGLTNMKEPAFNKLKEMYPAEFGDRQWSDLMGDNHLAVKAAAYNLKRLQLELGPKVPTAMKARYSLNEILAAGYNAEDYFYRPHDGYLVRGELGDNVSDYVLRSMKSFDRAQSVIGKLYTWQDVVKPGMPTHNPLVNPDDPHTSVVDIPPTGGYPKTNGPGDISGQVGVPRLPELDLAGWLTKLAGQSVSGLGRWLGGIPGPTPQNHADGGDVRGPGSSIGDKIPAYLSDGEFVMNARTTSMNRPFLQALNSDPTFLQKMLSQRDERSRGGGGGYAPAAPGGQPATVNISTSSTEDIVSRLKVLSLQWELMHSH